MASYQYTFQSGDTVTPQRLNDARTVGNIVNADIDAAAAIAGTKIAPDFGSQNVQTSGSVGIGVSPLAALHVQRSAGGAIRASGTVSEYTAVQIINTSGVDTQLFANANSSGGVMTTTNHPLLFSTNSAERMRIDASGNVGIGKVPSTKLDVDGAISATSVTATTFTGSATSIADGAVSTTAKLADGVVTNNKVSNSAAIAGTKISPAFGAQNVQADQLLLNGAGGGVSGAIRSTSATSFAPSVELFNTANDATAPSFVMHKYRGSSGAQNADTCGNIVFSAYDGSNAIQNASISAVVDGTVSAGSVSGRLVFGTRQTTGFLLERMRINAAGNIGINTTSPSSRLHVDGDLTVSNATTATTATAGAETLPANPAGFLVVSINGTSRKIPYYAT